MLNSAQTAIIYQAQRAMDGVLKEGLTPATRAALALSADGMGAVILAVAKWQAAHDASLASRRGGAPGPRGGRPPRGYAVDCEPGDMVVVFGAVQAAAKVAELVRQLAPRTPATWDISAASLHNAMGRGGTWFKNVDTANGVITVSVRRATPEQEAYAASLAAENETGTEAAQSKTRAKKDKSSVQEQTGEKRYGHDQTPA